MKKWSKEEITKRLDNLRKVCSNYFVDQAIMYGKFKTTNEVDALHFAFYWLKDNKLKYRREIFGKPNKIVLETDSPYYACLDYAFLCASNSVMPVYTNTTTWTATTCTTSYIY